MIFFKKSWIFFKKHELIFEIREKNHELIFEFMNTFFEKSWTFV
jgi:hypothetical protein